MPACARSANVASRLPCPAIRVLLGSLAVAGACAFLAAPLQADEPDKAGVEFFEKHIRPVLVAHCYECHSAEAKKLRGGLLLDSRDAARAGGDSGAAVVPGKPDESLILEALRYESYEMPPSGKLDDAVIADFAKWIEMGAPDPRQPKSGPAPEVAAVDPREHWSFQPIATPDVPQPTGAAWPASDIDRFILARLEAAGLDPGRDAEPTVLARRAFIDLTGLPPTVEELDAFASAYSADPEAAWPELVERLLASPQFGQRWGRHWLDLARYADSTGGGRSMLFGSSWRYRDFVIESLNDDLPYDQFIREQIAGDLLPYDDYRQGQRQVTATAFLALGPTNYESQDKDQLRMDVVDEQIDTVGRVFLGMTLGCARCHDHKFDPVPTADYYALAGIFGSTQTMIHENVSTWVKRRLPLAPDEQRAWDEHEAALAELSAQADRQKKLVKQLREDLPILVLDDGDARLVGSWQTSASVKPYVGKGYRYSQGREATATYKLSGRLKPGKYEVRVSYTPHPNRSRETRVTVRHADGSTDVTVDQTAAPTVEELFVSLGTFAFTKECDAAVEIGAQDEGRPFVVDAVECVPADQPAATGDDGDAGEPAATAAAALDAQLTELREAESQLKSLESRIKKLGKSAPSAPAETMSVRNESEMGDTQIRIRGNVDRLGDLVPRGFLSAVETVEPAPIAADASGRAELARWIADAEHPLTSRVMANRVWQRLFGQGIVRTTDNFGTTGEAPSHSELLDFLARRFTSQGWSVKQLIREIMLSRAYRLASEPIDEAVAADPDNRLLAHQNRRRLEAEVLYDAMLALGGNLDTTAGGQTVRDGTKSEYGYQFDVGRRAVYLPILRNNLPDLFAVFDFPDPNLSLGSRTTSTLATQALFLMNSPLVLDQSRRAAESLLAVEGLDDAARLDLWYRRALARAPRSAERERALVYLAADGETSEVDRWAAICHAVMASIDFRYLD